jgi:beta-glucanase (GH16 family)
MLRKLASLLLISTAAVPTVRAADAGEAPPAPATLKDAPFLRSDGSSWKLLWNDEFAGGSLDTTKWAIGLPWGGTDGTGRHHNEQYASYILDHNVAVGDGHLKLLTRRENITDQRGRVFHFSEGLITTAKSFRHRYGYWEARVKIPVEAGPGLWPAFWTLAEGWPPEMDICEVWTSTIRSHQGLCYRPPGSPRERWDDYQTRTTLPLDWATYGMEWGPGYQIYNLNGTVMHRVYGDHVPNDEHYILLNSGVESASPPTTATTFPNTFAVDYVRVYERPDVPAMHNGDFEDDDARPWNRSGQAVVVPYGARGGTRCLRVDGGPAVATAAGPTSRPSPASTAEQKVYGLKPATTYRLSGWIKRLTDAGDVRIGVKSYGGEEKHASATQGGGYERVELEFTTGEGATAATIYCYVPDRTAAALFDDLTLTASPAR